MAHLYFADDEEFDDTVKTAGAVTDDQIATALSHPAVTKMLDALTSELLAKNAAVQRQVEAMNARLDDVLLRCAPARLDVRTGRHY